MELFEGIRQRIGKLILAKKVKKTRRRVYYSNIKDIRNIGIVWDANRSEDFASLSEFHQKMHERNIDVNIIGYYEGEELPARITAIMYLSCIKRKELNFFYQPVSNDTDKFIKTIFDVLIDINFEGRFPLYYISSLSAASFKVGLYDSDEKNISVFDLMMELKKPVHVENYLDQVIHYLEMINSGSSNKVEKS